MRARLSSDLRAKGYDSLFQRVGPNRFALRAWELPEYVAPPFQKRLPQETVVCVPQTLIPAGGPDLGIWRDWQAVHRVLTRRRNLLSQPRAIAEARDDIRQLVVYAVLRDARGRLLTYRRGRYSSAPQLIRGARCLGFGGHVLQPDADNLFGLHDGGVTQAVYREIAEELDGIVPTRVDIVGVICDASSPEGFRHLGILMDGRLPPDYAEDRNSRERAVNDLRFLSPRDSWKRFHEFEFWSQLVLKELFPDWRMEVASVVRPRHAPGHGGSIIVVGEIATGKTTFSRLLREHGGFGIVSTRQCVANLIGVPDFGDSDRTQFQRMAAQFMAADGAAPRLADEIARVAAALPGRAVIDGVRHRGTLEALRQRLTDVLVVYIDCARDDAFRNFRMATGRDAPLTEFRHARAHEVEEEVRALRHDADAYVFNGGEPSAMLEVSRGWWDPSGDANSDHANG